MFCLANIRPFGHNIGNEAINLALRNLIYESFGRLVTIVNYPATNKYETNAKAGFSSAVVHELNRFADGVILGGGNLFENNDLIVDKVALDSLLPPLMLFSNSYGRIYGRKSALISRSDSMSTSNIKSLVDKSSLSLSRDSSTHLRIKSINSKDALGYCPTISLGRYKAILPELPIGEEPGVLISVRSPGLMNVPYQIQSYIPIFISNQIKLLKSKGFHRIRILCNDTRDIDFASSFRYTDNVDYVYTHDVYQYLSLLNSCDLLLSFRLHATLPALSYGRRVVNYLYDERASSLIHDLHAANSSLNIVENFDAIDAKSASKIDEALSHLNIDYISKWHEIIDFQISKLNDFRDLVKSYVTS